MIQPRFLDHAAFRISDPQRSIDFYENVLGMTRLARPDFRFGGAWYKVGEHAVHLIQSEDRHKKIEPLGPHLALDVANYDEVRQLLTERGVVFVEMREDMGTGRQLWVADPDGNTIEMRTNPNGVPPAPVAANGHSAKIKPTVLAHAGLRIADPERSSAFYEGVLGLKRMPRPNFKVGGIWYGFDDRPIIHLIASQDRGMKIDPYDPHIAIEVADFAEARRALTDQQIEIYEEKTMGAGRQLWLHDPDGNSIELRTNEEI